MTMLLTTATVVNWLKEGIEKSGWGVLHFRIVFSRSYSYVLLCTENVVCYVSLSTQPRDPTMERFTWSLDVQKTIRGGDLHFRAAMSPRSRRRFPYWRLWRPGAPLNCVHLGHVGQSELYNERSKRSRGGMYSRKRSAD